MTTQVATAEQQQRAPARVTVAAGSKLAAFVPTTMEEAWRLSGALAASGMTPKSYSNDQNKIMVGIMAGAEVGLTPFAALQSIAVIGNNPSLWGDGALALVQASGLLEDMEETDDGSTATCRLNRVGRSTPIVRTFSMEDAKKAGLSGKAGPWTQYPARMRQMRARAFAMRDGFSDVLKGLHIAEEARDYTPMGGGAPIELQSQPLTSAMLIEQASPKPTIADDLNDSIPALDPEPNDGALSEDNPHAAEGPADEQRGEANTGAEDEPIWAQHVRGIRASIAAAKTVRAIDQIERDWTNRVMNGVGDDALVREVEGEFAAKKRELKAKQEG